MGKRVKVCKKCWHEDCDGNCRTPAQRAAANTADLAAQIAARRKAEESEDK
jgi:hypothetical protein